MRIGGSGTVSVDVIPSGAGTMRLNDLVSERDGVLISPYVNINNVASEYGCVQLLNAAASGRRLLVDGLIILGSTSIAFQLRSHNTALATDEGAWASINPGAAAGNAHVFSDTLVALPGDLIVQIPKPSATVVNHWTLTFPIMLDEDEGLVLVAPTVNKNLTATFIGREV